MKITDVKVSFLTMPFPEKFVDAETMSRGEEVDYSWYLVKIFTDEGIVGIGGQGVYHSNMSPGWTRFIEKSVKPFLIKEVVNPLFVEKFSKYINSQGPGIYPTPKPCCVEMALWDIVGKKAGLPIYKILGATKTKVKAYASLLEPYPLLSPKEWSKFVKNVSEEGFKAVKLHVGNRWGQEGVRKILDIVEEVRSEVGGELELMIDVMKAWAPLFPFDYNMALELAKGLEKYHILYLEEPLPHFYNPELCSRLCDSVDIEIAGGGGMCGWQSYKTLLEKGALDIVQPDVQWAGGISEIRKIDFLSKIYGRSCIPHFWGPGIALAATLQLIGTIDSPYVEYNYHPPAWVPESRDAMLKDPIKIDEDGFVKIPEGPGLGVEINEEYIERYEVEE